MTKTKKGRFLVHHDHHNEPRKIAVKDLDEAVDRVKRYDPMDDPVERIRKELEEQGQYDGCDTWILKGF